MNILNRIPDMDRLQLQALMESASRLAGCDLRAPVVLEACEEALERLDTGDDSAGRAEALMRDIAERNGWLRFRDNQAGDGLKLGTGMLAGPVFASFCVSCKPPGATHAASFEVVLWERDDVPEFWVYGYEREDARELQGVPLLQTSVLDKAVTVFEQLVAAHKLD